MGWRYYEEYYPPSRPIAARGGIKAQSKGGRIGANWWAQRWIAALERVGLGSRLTRGKTYARAGQVLAIEVGPGRVTASVQGSRPTPYAVTIAVTPLTAAEWQRVGAALARQAAYAATLLAGEMPQEIEAVFHQAGLSLFPASLAELRTSCSCPDAANPCKHIAAVYYLLGEDFDRDPFLLFRLRGLERDELLARLTAAAAGEAGAAPAASAPSIPEPEAAAEPLPAEAAAFWGGDAVPDDLLGEVRPAPVAAALLRRLGKFPFWRGEEGLVEALGPVYARAARRGLEIVVGATATTADVAPSDQTRPDV